jgi:glycosyltransferase involved in cell wall biosynthesis
MHKISVVLPVYICNQELLQLTRNCLYSICDELDELIIVDDYSPQSTKEFEPVATKIIHHKERMGYIKSANDGFKRAKGDYICLVCNDTKLLRGTLQDLCNEGYSFPVIQNKAIPFWDGAFYCFPRKLKGLYDEQFENYFGDLDKFYDAKQKAISLQTVNNVHVWHHQSATTQTLQIRESSFAQDKIKWMKKWGFDPEDDYYNLI